MKPEEQRIAIAKACGWTEISPRMTWGLPPNVEDDGTENCLKQIPDYLNDLNAMHEAEKQMNTKVLWEAYKAHLLNWMTEPVCASARQRAEAFLKTIGKWEGENDE